MATITINRFQSSIRRNFISRNSQIAHLYTDAHFPMRLGLPKDNVVFVLPHISINVRNPLYAVMVVITPQRISYMIRAFASKADPWLEAFSTPYVSPEQAVYVAHEYAHSRMYVRKAEQWMDARNGYAQAA